MGFLGLSPADEVTAVYDFMTSTLTLTAIGSAPRFSYGFKFVPTPFTGVLKYDFECWTGPRAPGSDSFKHYQNFLIPDILPKVPSGNVIVNTANIPNRVVKIEWVNFDAKSAVNGAAATIENITATVKKDEPMQLPVTSHDKPEEIYAHDRKPFLISVPIDPGWSYNAKYDEHFLVLLDSGVTRGTIWWRFVPVQMGKTQVDIIGNAPPPKILTTVKTYIVDVLPFPAATSDTVSNIPGIPLNFIGMLGIAEKVVQADAPGAQLIQATATLPRGPIYPVTDPRLLNQIQCVFRTEHGSAVVHSLSWGSFSKPVFSTNPRLGLPPIDIEKGVKLDPVAAVDKMHEKGITMAFFQFSLFAYDQVVPGYHDEPYYQFNMLNASTVEVGSRDGDVIGK